MWRLDVATPGQGREIRGDLFDHIVWNMHYQSTGQPETARPSIGAWFANDEITTYQQTLSTSEYTSESEQLIAPAPRTRKERLAAGELPLQIAQNINPLLAPIPPNAANWNRDRDRRVSEQLDHPEPLYSRSFERQGLPRTC